MLWRVAREGDIISGVLSGVIRREGRGGGGLNVGVELAEESPLEWELQLLLPFRRGGGGGGTVRPDREGGLSFDGDKVLSMLSLELLILSEYDHAWSLMFILGAWDGIVGGSDDSDISDSSSDNGLCLEEELDLLGSSNSSPLSKRTERRWGGGGGGGGGG